MQTAAATVNQMLQLVVSDRLRQLGEGDGVPNALVIFRDDHVSAVADLAWADDAAKRAVLGACRELLLALQGDAVALVLDTFISADADIAPSENPAAREALCALGLLAAGDLTMAQFIYGRHDDGSVYLDAPATTELAEKMATRSSDPVSSIGGSLLDVFAAALDTTGTDETADTGRVRAALDALGRHGCEAMVAPHIMVA